MKDRVDIGVVGPCAAGKSTLIAGLKDSGYKSRHIAQEHSHVPDMWQRLTNPRFLIYLDVSFPVSVERRKLNWTLEEYLEQVNRLRHARQHADFYLDTDPFTIQEVLDQVLSFLQTAGADIT
jgi:cytidylate kinase